MMRLAALVCTFAALAYVGNAVAQPMDQCDTDLAHLVNNDTLKDSANTEATNANLWCGDGQGLVPAGDTSTITGDDAGDAGDDWKAICCGNCAAGTARAAATNAATMGECTACVAADGKYQNAGTQTACLDCATCVAGQFANGACGAGNQNRDCQACDAGTTFSTTAMLTADPDLAACQACQTCGPGFYVETACTVTTDTQCTACADGTFSTTTDNGNAVTTCGACDGTGDVACPEADATEQTKYYKCDGTENTSCAALTECAAGKVEDTAPTKELNGDRTCKDSPASTMAIGFASAMAVFLTLLL